MSKAPGWGGGPWALVVELSVLCPWVCFGKSSQIYIYIYIYISGPSSYMEKGASCCLRPLAHSYKRSVYSFAYITSMYLVEKLKPEMFFITQT